MRKESETVFIMSEEENLSITARVNAPHTGCRAHLFKMKEPGVMA